MCLMSTLALVYAYNSPVEELQMSEASDGRSTFKPNNFPGQVFWIYPVLRGDGQSMKPVNPRLNQWREINGCPPIAAWQISWKKSNLNGNWGYPYFRKPAYGKCFVATLDVILPTWSPQATLAFAVVESQVQVWRWRQNMAQGCKIESQDIAQR